MSHSEVSVLIYDKSGRLESYYDTDISGGKIELMATKGYKKAVIVSFIPEDEKYFENIGTFEALSRIEASYVQEDPSHPMLHAVYEYDSGESKADEITLQALLARIEIRYFTTDFSAEPYSGSRLTNARAYLTDISGSCGILGSSFGEKELINSGGFDYYGISNFRHPDIVYSTFVEGAVLYCYPSSNAKLVIEGIIDGNIYYYPIDLNAEGCLECGGNYVYDIFIKKKGVTDPETIADPQTININIKKNPWEEKEGQYERF